MTVITREKERFSLPGRKGLSRTCVFADDHIEIHRAANGDFTAWERERGLLAHP